MISGLDHIVLLVSDLAAAAAAYQTLFARTPAWRGSGDGAERVLFTLDNMTLELLSPSGEGVTADRIHSVIAEQGEGLASLCFRTLDIGKMHRRLERLSLRPEPVAEAKARMPGPAPRCRGSGRVRQPTPRAVCGCSSSNSPGSARCRCTPR